jgi:hypothetical protein
LEDTRRGHVEREVEEEFKTLQKEKMAQKSLALQANPASAIVGKKKAGQQVAWEMGEDGEDDETPVSSEPMFDSE